MLCRDLGWQLWHGVQQTFINEYGSDPQASSRTQVLRLPGTLHQKDPAKPHLVRIVEELSSWQVYSAAEIAAAFPPRPISQPRRLRRSSARAPGSDWEPEKILSAFVAIDARLKESGPFTAQGDQPATNQLRWTGRCTTGGFEPWPPFIMRAVAQKRVSSCRVR